MCLSILGCHKKQISPVLLLKIAGFFVSANQNQRFKAFLAKASLM